MLISPGLTTFLGATGEESCVPKASQLSPEAGQAYFATEIPDVNSLLTSTSAGSLAACLGLCPAASSCLMQYHVQGSTCKYAALAPVAPDAPGYKLLYKLPPSGLIGASSVASTSNNTSKLVRAKMMSSGIYARVAIPDATRSKWLLAGTNLDTSARTFTTAAQSTLLVLGTEATCQSVCGNSNVC
jgi:hypothetical protein